MLWKTQKLNISLSGQPPQRPPNLGPAQGLGGAPFRSPYPTAYSLPPGGGLRQGFPGLTSGHRTPGQNMVLQSPGFIQQRGQTSYPFGTSLQPHPPAQAHPTNQTSLGHSQAQQPPQPSSATTTSSSLPPHLQSGGGAPGLGNTQSGSSGGDVALDPNDFPALGSGSTGANGGAGAAGATSSPVTTLASSYASQAGTGGASAGQSVSTGTTGNANGPRDFTPDDFPALGGQSSTQQSTQSQSQSNQAEGNASHPPGLNGFENRQQPGLIHLGAARGIPQQQGDTEKRVSDIATKLFLGLINRSPRQNSQPGTELHNNNRMEMVPNH